MNKQFLKNINTNRWYDESSQVSVAVQLLKKFPLEIQTIICEGLSRLAEKGYQVSALMKSLGTDKVLAIHKSHLKRRSYDQNPTIFKAMNYLFILTSKNRHFISEQILGLMSLIRDYLTLCHDQNQSVNPKHVEAVTYTYVDESPEAAQLILKEIRQEFMTLVQDKVHQLNHQATEAENKKISQNPDHYH